MEMSLMFDIIFFRDDNGRCPVEEFLFSLSKNNLKLFEKTLRSIQLLKENGNRLSMPFSEYLRDGIFELRTIQGNNTTRLLYFFDLDKIIIVTNGFEKKTQKTPDKELAKAIRAKQEYERRRRNG